MRRCVPLEKRFWAKVHITSEDGCWLWTGFLQGKGYGGFRLPDGRQGLAHRIAYQLRVGPIPDGLTIDHLCRVRACVNPKHLEAVTAGVNTLRGMTLTASNLRKTHCPKGHEYNTENTRIRKGGGRHCRACHRRLIHDRRQRMISHRMDAFVSVFNSHIHDAGNRANLDFIDYFGQDAFERWIAPHHADGIMSIFQAPANNFRKWWVCRVRDYVNAEEVAK